MNLSKANAKKYSSWAFQQQRKIADMPLLIGQLLTKCEGLTILYKVIVVREAVNPISQSNPRTPVVYESEIYKSEKPAWKDAIENCT